MLKAVSYCVTLLVSRFSSLSASYATGLLPLSQTTSETMEINDAEQSVAVSDLLAADVYRETMASHSKASSYCCSPCNLWQTHLSTSTPPLFMLVA